MLKHESDKILNIKQKGQKVKQVVYKLKNEMTASELKKHIPTVFKGLPKDAEVKITLQYENQFRSANWFKYENKEDIVMFDPESLNYEGGHDFHKDTISRVIFYLTKTPPAKGGASKSNNCFFVALKKSLVKLQGGDTPIGFKKLFKLNKDEMFPVSKIPDVEERYKVNINITGDYNYTSKHQYIRTVNMQLKNEHYTLKKNKSFELLKSINNKEKELCIFKKDGNIISYYNGKSIKQMNYEDYIIEKEKLYLTSKYLFIKSETDNLKEYYEKYIIIANKLKKVSKDEINLYRNNYKKEALRFFYLKARCYEADNIDETEAHWIKSSMRGGLMYVEKGEYENVKSYDINSMYSHIMKKLAFPIKKGTYTQIKEFETIINYGIYRCKIEGNKLFVTNKSNYYTHFDIQNAIKLNCKIELIIDEQANALIYDNTCRANNLFFHYVEEVFKWKKEEPEMKKILNILWGALCERKQMKQRTTDNISVDLIEDVIKINDEYTLLKCSMNDNYYVTNYARIGPFITAYGRKMISELVLPHEKSVIRVQTDSFTCLNNINCEISKDIGKLKLEYENKNIIISYLNKINCKNCNKNIKECIKNGCN